ncbi:T9SS type A sorting domain-containing protein [Chryseobacterium sp. KACC 21268]|nr:T9SS type A sorting domain-containing protein [Chryseobacterium sp. KACC 21268]
MKTKLLFFLTFFSTINIFSQSPSIQWQKAYGGSEYDQAKDIRQTSDGGYIIVGDTQSNDGDVTGHHAYNDIWVIKLSSNGSLQWQKAFGGSGSEEAYTIRQTSDGGYIIGGWTGSTDGDITDKRYYGFDFWVIKISSIGEIQWQKTFGGNNYEYVEDIHQTTDGGYIVAGWTSSFDGDITDSDVDGDVNGWIIKLNNTGNVEWQKTYGGTNSDYLQSIQQTPDGGYIAAGWTYSNDGDVTENKGNYDYWVLKLDNTGSIQWQKTYGGTGSDIAYSIERTSDGGYIVGGNTESNNGDVTGSKGGMDYWVLKISSNGTKEWQKTLGGSSYDEMHKIHQTTDGEYILTGRSFSTNGDVTGNHGGADFWVVKLNSLGTIKWKKTLGGSQYDQSYCLQQTNDGGYIVAGWTASTDGDTTNSNYHGSADVWVVKLAADNLDVQDLSKNKSFTLYPNPTADILYLQSAKKIDKIILTDLSGKKILEETHDFTKINLQSLQKGTYLIQIISEGKTTIEKVIKK